MIMFLCIFLLLLSAFLVMIVLVQRGRGGGLAGAFGSGGGASSAFGTKTGDVFTTVTVIAFVLFMLLSIALSFKFQDKPVAQNPGPAPAAPVAPVAPGGGAPSPTTPSSQTKPEATGAATGAASGSATNPASAPASAPTSRP